MQTFFLICAGLGGTLMVCQFLASLLGLGGDHGDAGHGHFDAGHVGHDAGHVGHDAGHDSSHAHGHDSDQDNSTAWHFGMLSLRALAAAVTFFGLAGLAAHYGGLPPAQCLLIGLAGGAAALYAVASMMRLLARLKSDGTVRMERAVGEVGTVYLRIPAAKSGAGKVTLVLQSRTVECQAITALGELPTGARVKVVALAGPDTVEVVPATLEASTHA